MEKEFEEKYPEKLSKLRFFIGDVRDQKSLHRAFKGIDYVIYTAAMKQGLICKYNPFKSIKTIYMEHKILLMQQ